MQQIANLYNSQGLTGFDSPAFRGTIETRDEWQNGNAAALNTVQPKG